MHSDSVTNQQFPIVSPALKAELAKHYRFEQIEALDENNIVIRFVTSFATAEREVERFESVLASCIQNCK